jgi:hypothetical protein
MADNPQSPDTRNGNGSTSNGAGQYSAFPHPAAQISKPGTVQNLRQDIIQDRYPVAPHISTFAGRYQAGQQQYWIYFDQALKDSQQNSLTMRGDAFMHELLRHRQEPLLALPYHMETDDPDHPDQKSISETVNKIVTDIPNFKTLLLNLTEAFFYGKFGEQLQLGPRKVAGNEWNSVQLHIPMNGDKFRFKWDGTPGIAIYGNATGDKNYFPSDSVLSRYENFVEPSMLGKALFLKNQFLRDRFIIHSFESSDTDYLYELEMAQSIFGMGLRSRLYWAWNLRNEIFSWMVDALQRVGANGLLYGFHQSGNMPSQIEVLNALKMLVKDNIASFPVLPGQDPKDMIHKLDSSPVGYEVMFEIVKHLEGIMRRAVLGQDASSETKPQGLGGGPAAQLKASVRRDYLVSDSYNLAETLTEQLVKNVILRYNKWSYEGKTYKGDDLPFGMRMVFQIEEENPAERVETASMLFNMGVELDKDDIRKVAGFSPPKKKDSILANPQIQSGQQQVEAGMPGVGHLN